MSSNPKQLAVLAAGIAALGGTAIVLAEAGAASAAPPTHTFTVSTRQLQDKIVNGVDIATDKDAQRGSVTGYDVTACRVDVASHIARCDVALARAGGLLFGHARINVVTGHGAGAVTGGTRHYQGASGVITIASPRVTVTWSN